MKKRKLRPPYADIILAIVATIALYVLFICAQRAYQLESRNHEVERISGGDIQAAGVDLYKKRGDNPPKKEHPLKKEFPELFATDAVVVSFGADWCPWCKRQARELRGPSHRFNILYVEIEEVNKAGETVPSRWGRLLDELELGESVPVTAVVEKGDVTKTFIGYTPWATIRQSAGKAKKNEDEEGTIIIGPIRIDWGPDDVDIDLNRYRNNRRRR